jgi:ComF family protein
VRTVFVSIHLACKWFFDACFPAQCLKCGKEGTYLCQKHYIFLPVSKNVSPLKNISNVFAAVAYDNTAEKLIDYFKFRGVSGIADILADEIILRIDKEFLKNAVLVPIPLHWTRKFWRGFNQAEILAEAISSRVPSLSICNNLKREKRTSQQARLKKKAREENIAGAFFWESKDPPPFKIILVDDVAATGATLDEAARTLQKKGAKEIFAIVFARGKV